MTIRDSTWFDRADRLLPHLPVTGTFNTINYVMLDKEFQYYKDHQRELVRLYDGKFLVIVDEEVKSVHDSGLDAYVKAEATYPPGTFLIQQCSAGEESYTQTYHSPRVIV